MTEANETPLAVFKGMNDRYNGIIVSSDMEKCDSDEFSIKLQESLKQWIEKNRRGIWFKVFLNQSHWVPHLITNGFKYHHAREEYVMLYRWLPEGETCNIPPYAHTSIGVGSVVVNDNNEILVVSEKYRFFEHWKLPGGYVEPGENLIDAAVREVMEETGIKTEFLSLLSFRHAHGGIFDCSDMYVVVALKALTTDLKKCDRELADCAWMNINEYLAHPQVHELNRLFVEKYLEYKNHNLKIRCDHGIHSKLNKEYMVYHVVKENL
ncbi:nudix hydrolase related [Holotrichia oblita]|uniref:Nudix hydrolase related n=1 Tax=Holotrichia oblita TaxID=644536 RepID=A0ACB9SPU3_HOLOL|nr:nudix hydrolase related [Holotrichia oblita]